MDQKGKEDISITTAGYHRSFFTVVLTVTATGEKLKLILIFERKTMLKVKLPEGVVVTVNQKGWFTNKTMKERTNVWNERSDYDVNPEKSFSVVDSARSHLQQEAREELKKVLKVAIIPGRCTQLIQPLDIDVNRSFKENLRTHWMAWYADEAQAEYMKMGERKRPGYEMIVQRVKSSFEDVNTECVINSFKKRLTPDHNYRMESMIAAFTSLVIDDDDEVSDLNTTFDSMNLGA